MGRTIGLEYATYPALDIDNADIYNCFVSRYFLGHSCLLIEAHNFTIPASKSLYLLFEAVDYYDGPVRWGGIKLRVVSFDELVQFADEKSIPSSSPYLSIFENSGRPIRILAAGWVSILDEMPEFMR